MAEMLRGQNPGLASRFPISSADYTDRELLEICASYCKKTDVIASLDVQQAIIKDLGQQRRLANFGNARAAEDLVKNAMNFAVARIRRSGGAATGAITLKVDDVASEVARRSADHSDDGGGRDPLSLLDGLYRMDNIRKVLSQLGKHIQVARTQGEKEPSVGHFVFRGSPGTGKTTVARAMESILFRMGVLGSDRVVETSRNDMTGEYLGQTKTKVVKQLQEARGAILFIDEAYAMGKGPYGEEALTSLVAAMTDPTYKGMVVIIAGYTHDLDRMLSRNVGLRSRFDQFIDFEDWEVDDCIAALIARAAKENYTVDPAADAVLRTMFKQLREYPDFGNGRDVNTVWEKLKRCRSVRVWDQPEPAGQWTIQAVDADETSRLLLKEKAPPNAATENEMGALHPDYYGCDPYSRTPGEYLVPEANVYPMLQAYHHLQNRHRGGIPSFNEQARSQTLSMQSHSIAQSTANSRRTTEQSTDQEPKISIIEDDSADASVSVVTEAKRDPGVSGAVWRELEAAKENYQQLVKQAQREEKLRKAREEAERKLHEIEAEQQRLREEAERLARAEAERLVREEAERKERERLAHLERIRQEEEKARPDEELRRLKAEADQRAREEAERKHREYMAHLEKLRQQEEAARKARELLRLKEEAERIAREEAARKAREEAERKHQEHLAHLEKLRREEEAARKLKEEADRKLREYQAKQERLRQLRNCPAGYQWYQTSGGWQCGGGSHFVSDAELERSYTHYT